jgi:hypothetical protein
MPKLTKENNKKADKPEKLEKLEKKEEIVDEHITDNDDEIESDNESAPDSGSEEETTQTEDKKKQKKLTAHELFNEISDRFSMIVKADEAFVEKEKEFEREQKEFASSRKKITREIDGLLKRFEKAFTSEVGKKKKPRKTENAGKGGFNKPSDVPEVLRKYIGIGEDEQKTRPEVTKLLNEKFKEAGLMKTEKDENDKEIKYIILDKATAKKLGHKDGEKIRNKDIQTFIAQFYRKANTVDA